MEIVLFFAKMVGLVAGFIFLYANHMPVLVGSLVLLVLLGGLILGVMYLLESPRRRYGRRMVDAALKLRLEEAREDRALRRITTPPRRKFFRR